MKVRVITAIFLLITLVPAVLIGGLLLDIVLAMLSMGATYELFKMYKADEFKINGMLLIELLFSLAIFFSVAYYLKGTLDLEYVFVLLLFVIFSSGLSLIFKEDFNDLGNILRSSANDLSISL